jgi:hypothetical protein
MIFWLERPDVSRYPDLKYLTQALAERVACVSAESAQVRDHSSLRQCWRDFERIAVWPRRSFERPHRSGAGPACDARPAMSGDADGYLIVIVDPLTMGELSN